ncbi:hypothetical protein M405DRAFT_831048, partial [Rhizopogon salebrosus TDB-379]
MTNTNLSSQKKPKFLPTSKSSADPRSIDEPSDEQARLLHAACVCQDWELARRYVLSSWLFLPLLLEHACTTPGSHQTILILRYLITFSL